MASNLAKVVCRTAAGSPSKAITLEAATLARFSDGSCTCSLGDTSVLVTAVSRPSQKPPANFVPLSVEYRQKAAAAGRIPMTHLRRDVGTTEKETLTGRMIDRSLRPAFNKGFNHETQIICNLLAVDGANDPDVLAINGASATLAISDIPWNGPIGAVRMGLVGENLVVNPTRREQENSRLNLIMSANGLGNVIMMDGHCREPVLIVDFMKAMKQGIKECTAIVNSITQLQQLKGKAKKELDLSNLVANDELKELAKTLAQDGIKKVLTNHTYDKKSRDDAMTIVINEAIEKIKEAQPETDLTLVHGALTGIIKETYKQILSETGVRCDGRQFNQLRPISCQVDLYKPLHGSALFQRGQTQVFCSTTFDSPDAAFRSDSMTVLLSGVKEKNFMLHYEFPPFATREIGRVGSAPDRREIGHGALAEKGIRPVVPDNHEMTIRLNCEVLESNGSSSMASVCAGSLSLMDAGVKIKEPVAGVAMGLISDLGERKESKEAAVDYHVLTDILGFEDYIGDMDFKIAGTKKAITALQLDVKPMYGIPASILYKALQRAHTARSEIINLMSKTIREPRAEKKDNHPVMKSMHVPAHKRAKLVGFGGANLKKITAEIGVRMSLIDFSDEEETLGAQLRDNLVIFAPNKEAMQEAEEYIQKLLAKEHKEVELEFNGIYTATIQEIRQNGVMITLYPNMKPALLPLSQLDVKPILHPDVLKLEVGQQIQVKYFGRDPSSGQMRLSRKSLLMSGVSKVHRAPTE